MANANDTVNVTFLATDRASGTIKNLESSLIRFVGAVASAMAALRAATFPLQEAANFQREMLNISKTTDFSKTELQALANELRKLSSQVDVSATDLAKIAAAAGQLGLKGSVADVAQFTDSVARISSVLDVDVTKAAEGVAKLQNIFQIRLAETEKIGSLLNQLSNNSTMNGEDAFDIIQRIGTAGNTLTIKQSAALAAYGKDLGLSNEVIGTSFNKIFLDLQAKSADIAEAMGIPVAEWAMRVRTDGIGALKDYVNFLNKLPAAQAAAFAEKTTGGGRIFALITNIMNDAKNTNPETGEGFSLLEKELRNAKIGFDEGTSAIKEQETVLQGFLKQLKILGNVIGSTLAKEGEKALPFLTEYVKKLQQAFQDPEVMANIREFMGHIGRTAAAFIQATEAVLKFVAGLQPLVPLIKVIAQLLLLKTIANLAITAFSGIATKITALKDGTKAWLGVLSGSPDAIRQAQAAFAAAKAPNIGKDGTLTPKDVAIPAVTRLGAAYGAVINAQRRAADATDGLNTALDRQAVLGQNNARAYALYQASLSRYNAAAAAVSAAQTKQAAQQAALSAKKAKPADIKASAAYYDSIIARETELANKEVIRQQRLGAFASAQQARAQAAIAAATAEAQAVSRVDRVMDAVRTKLGPMGTGVAFVAGQFVRVGIAAQSAAATVSSTLSSAIQKSLTLPGVSQVASAYTAVQAAQEKVVGATTRLNGALDRQAVTGANNKRALDAHTASMARYNAAVSNINQLQAKQAAQQAKYTAAGAAQSTLDKSFQYYQRQIDAQTELANKESSRQQRINALVVAQQTQAAKAVAAATAEAAAITKTEQRMAALAARMAPLGTAVAGVAAQFAKIGVAAEAAAGIATAAAARAKAAWAGAAPVFQKTGAVLGKALGIGMVLGLIAELLDMVGLLKPLTELFKSLFYFGNTSSYKELRLMNAELVKMREEQQKVAAAAAEYDRALAAGKLKPVKLEFDVETGGVKLAEEMDRAGQSISLAEGKMKSLNAEFAQNQITVRDIKAELAGIDTQIAKAKVPLPTTDEAGQLTNGLEVTEANRKVNELFERRLQLMQLISPQEAKSVAIAQELGRVEAVRLQALSEVARYYDDDAVALAKQKQAQLDIVAKLDAQKKKVEELRAAQAQGGGDLIELAGAERQLNILSAQNEKAASDFKNTWTNSTLAVRQSYGLMFKGFESQGADAMEKAVLSANALAGKADPKLEVKTIEAQKEVDDLQRKLTELERRRTLVVDTDADSTELKEVETKLVTVQSLLVSKQANLSFLKTIATQAKEASKNTANIVPAAERTKQAMSSFMTATAKFIMASEASDAVAELKKNIDGLAQNAKNSFERMFTDLASMSREYNDSLADLRQTAATRGGDLAAVNVNSQHDRIRAETEKWINDLKAQGVEISKEEEQVIMRTLEHNRQRALLQAKENSTKEGTAFAKAEQEAAVKRAKEVATELDALRKDGAANPEQSKRYAVLLLELAELEQKAKQAQTTMLNLNKDLDTQKLKAIRGPVIDGASGSFEYDAKSVVSDFEKRMKPILDASRAAVAEIKTINQKAANEAEFAAAGLAKGQEQKLTDARNAMNSMAEAFNIGKDELSQFQKAMREGDPILAAFSEKMKAIAVPDFSAATQQTQTLVDALKGIDTTAKQVSDSALEKLKGTFDEKNIGALTEPMLKIFMKEYTPTIKPKLEMPADIAATVQSSLSSLTITPQANASTIISNVESAFAGKTFDIKVNPVPQGAPAVGGKKDGGYIGGRTTTAMTALGTAVKAAISLPKFATGGPIRGAGTSRSDSILSWLSHGEYVMDAKTVRRFGMPFFSWLQNSASRPSLSMANLPKFADGGPVGVSDALLQSFANSESTRDSVDVNLSVAGEKIAMRSSREDARKLVKALSDINRGL